jgi:MYXO-CTERM domain-containing protein
VLTRSLAAAAALGLAALLAAGQARAYCRTSTTSTATFEGHVCTPAQDSDSGLPLYWGMPVVTYSLQQDASEDVPLDAFRTVVRAAFDTWMNADCDGEPPRIEIIEAEDAVCALHEYNQELGNANILFFQDTGWPFEHNRLAITTVTFDKKTGEIFDADMVLNSEDFLFGMGELLPEANLQSVLTHEAGHFLGLAHSPAGDATMMPSYSPPSTGIDQRDLAQDDIDGICAIYPPGPIADGCDATPRHGFSTLCASDQPGPVPDEPPTTGRCCCVDGAECVDGACVGGGCNCGTAPAPDAPWPVALGLAVALSALARRRARVRC